MNGIITLPLVPLRETDNERSELLSQLLFGELLEIIETKEKWIFVQNLTDNYRGWVDRKMVEILTSTEKDRLLGCNRYIIQKPIILTFKTKSGEKMFLPGGSIIYPQESGKYIIGSETYSVDPTELASTFDRNGEKVIQLAKNYLNSPYLWGGKSVLGIDCSGLVQVVFSMCGIQLPRDASQQVEKGWIIDILSEANAGDLAFFENKEGRIIHVGILLNSHQIIHASGHVKIESIDSQGIISAHTGEYTHKLRVIKRIFI